MIRIALLHALALAVLCAACGRDAAHERLRHAQAARQPRTSAFTVSLSGDARARFTGSAIACADITLGDSATFVEMEAGNQRLYVHLPTTHPATGDTFSVRPGRASATYSTGSDEEDIWGSFQGVVRITRADQGRLAGTVHSRALKVHSRRSARVDAEFEAVRTGYAVNGACDPHGGAATGAAQAARARPLLPGRFMGYLESGRGKMWLEGAADLCMHQIQGTELFSVLMRDSSGTGVMVAMTPGEGTAEIGEHGARVWVDPPAGAGTRMDANLGQLNIERLDSAGVIGSIDGYHRPDSVDAGMWMLTARFHALPGHCRE
jgi:hypothetical protein